MIRDEPNEDRDALDARIDELLDERRDPLDDAGVVEELSRDDGALARVVALHGALRALPLAAAGAPRSAARPLLAAAALLVAAGLAILESRPRRVAPRDEMRAAPAVLEYRLTTTTRTLDRCTVEESDRFGVVRTTDTEEAPELRLVRVENRR